ncbi:LysR family transcriptional regulator [Sphingobium sp. CR2-8]|uniref:LysR family transcriptional regulator n=1 Tax=Sphingobium sp. CR2-8 TaxID=1306534 RepID=UPI002DB5F24E|nr:LysR family transcriptional regulator [Sphingobium sp. CR2-8]MEC3909328.1 LysR family transcriptional regulator [Sphingobium sp. CR2-8]
MLDRYLLRYFLAVVDQGNFSRAALHCHVSQPTLSVGIAKLERTLQLQLFIRSSQRVELTNAGARFLVHARRIEREFNNALQSMSGGDMEHPNLRIGILSSIPADVIADCIAQTRPTDGYRFELLFGSERELTGHLAKGRIDCALTLVGRGGDRFMERAVMTEGYGLALSANHPLAAEREIAPERLAQDVMIVRRHCEALSDTSRFFTERGIRPHFAFRSTNDERVLHMVAAGLGLTVMPACYRAPGVVRPRLAGFSIERTIGWAGTADAEYLLNDMPPLLRAIEERLSNLR